MSGKRGESGVVHILNSLNYGGAELRTIELVNRVGLRFDFLCISGQVGVLDEEVRAQGHRVDHLGLTLLNSRRIWRYFRDPRRVVVHSHAGAASGPIVLLAALAGVRKRIVHFRSDEVGGKRKWTKSVFLLVSRWLVRLLATDIVGVSPGALASAWRVDWKLDSRCRVIPNGIDVSAIRAKAVGGEHYGELTLIHVGRSDPAKNRERVLDIWRASTLHQPTRLLLVGRIDVHELEMVRQALISAPAASSIDVVGESSDVPRMIASSDVMLLPSRREGLPGVVLESLALGVPVVASRLPGTEWIAQELNGVHICGLEDEDEVWSSALARMAGADQVEIRRSFDRGPFTLEAVRPVALDLWGIVGA